MKKVRLTVLKTMLNEDLAKEYGLLRGNLLREVRFIVDQKRFLEKLYS